MKNLIINILHEDENQTLEFAALELKRYIAEISDEAINIQIQHNSDNVNSCISIGLYDKFNLTLQDLDYKGLDDAVYVKINELSGIISGPNPRSVLFSVYRFLEACGCRWIRPGKDGEYIPNAEIDLLSVNINEKASYRYRGYNACGTYSIEDYIDKIDWSAKMGINSVMNEFFLPVKAFIDYYSRISKSLNNARSRTIEEIKLYHQKGISEIKKRGLISQSPHVNNIQNVNTNITKRIS